MMTLLVFLLVVYAIIFAIKWFIRHRKHVMHRDLMEKYGVPANHKIVGFFHPYCNCGGGGERVLWTAIKCMLEKYKNIVIVIYTNDAECLSNPDKVLSNVRRIFGIYFNKPSNSAIHFVPLKSEILLTPKLYRLFTLAGQAFGSVLVGLEAIFRCPPDVYIDTTGFAFTIPLAKWLCNSQTAAYVHYPTISSVMLQRVSSSLFSKNKNEIVLTYNNPNWVRKNKIFSSIKFLYYNLFIKAYKFSGSSINVDVAMTNSSWTQKHIQSLWGGKPVVLYPPCPVEDLEGKLVSDQRFKWILSVGQFRPEKNHELQLDAFHHFLRRHESAKSDEKHQFKLLLIGGCRDDKDFALVSKLKDQAATLELGDTVEFHINLPYQELKSYFGRCSVNLHTMVDEHFGISVVEGMASGLITIAHRSGGPLTDIIGPSETSSSSNQLENSGVGFLASTVDEYANIFELVLLKMSESQIDAIRKNAIQWVHEKFSEDCFNRGWIDQMNVFGLESISA
ncbi:asparagine-linked glycosylation protein, variant 2 [Schistosoma haematobium]|uniref:GDP-Man:Man(3)GlcNAc(2)-PP-Dol alpha-1,2-mannosyltransferase n=1 Tax=Schistosoma haematobium TaxID=6185 RepID=A0A922LKC0_SCHHA|nr:asparagine-linked glycosylation protein, variant 2 [Schistosoma haematobium]KAH9587762.1 asparagine-linked glycosylation protein, variant 2 [Schistosoma haematobium]